MELIFLGTGAGVPSKKRNVSAIALSLLQEINEIWLFDCGEATQHQILHTSIKPGKITKIFITHLHGDHLFGLPGFLSSRSFQGGNEQLTVYGPKGIKKFINTALSVSETHLAYPLEIIEYTEGTIINSKKFSVSCIKLDHGIPSYGFRIVEKDLLGELLVDRLKEAGIKPGPIYRQIKENEQTMLPSGKIIYRKDYLGPTKRGRIVSILGDTRFRKEHVEFVKNSSILVHEATFSDKKADLANKYFHSTTTEAATIAKKANVHQLILTHISSRYQNQDINKLLLEAIGIFKKTKMAKDFDRFPIKRTN